MYICKCYCDVYLYYDLNVCSISYILYNILYIYRIHLLYMCVGGTAKAACYAVKRLGLKLLITNIQEEAGIEVAKRSEL